MGWKLDARVVVAIEKQEGFRPGTLAWINNNPGNLKMGKRARRFGAISMDDQHHAIFPSVEQGRAALEDLIQIKGEGQTLRQIGKWYAEDAGWATGVSKLSGVGLDEVIVAKEPKWLTLARQEIGTKELPGPRNNPEVVQYYVDAVKIKHPDSVPWCAAFCCSMLVRAGEKGWGNLMARGALKWGKRLTQPAPGAIVVFARGRPPSGHVAFVEEVRGQMLIVIGGNQRDAVTRAAYHRNKAIGYRWPTQAPTSTKVAKAVP